jgi:hypothetical protein
MGKAKRIFKGYGFLLGLLNTCVSVKEVVGVTPVESI